MSNEHNSPNERRIKSVIGEQSGSSSSKREDSYTATVNLQRGSGHRGSYRHYRASERPRSNSYVPVKTESTSSESNNNNNNNGHDRKRKFVASSAARDIFDLKIAKVKEEGKEEGIIPSRKSSGAGGLDLYTPIDGQIEPGKDKLLNLRIAMQIPEGYIGDVRTRSSIATKNKVDIPTGTIDSDYRGAINVYLRNCSESDTWAFKRGDRVAQMTLTKVAEPNPVEVSYEELTSTERGTGGFGSTGMNDKPEQKTAEKKAKDEFMAAEPKYRVQTGGPIVNYF
jgi:dUTP pyrophosphatase